MSHLRQLYKTFLNGLNRRPLGLSIALGVMVGLGLGLIAAFGIGGAVFCVLVLGATVWAAKDAGPVWVEDRAEVVVPSEPEVKPVFVGSLEMVELEGGLFHMGSPDRDDDVPGNEKPQHEIAVSAFAISRYPVTRELYRRVVDTAPKRWRQDRHDSQFPANYTSWFDAVAFCNALSQHVGLQPCYRIEGDHVTWDVEADGYRLPTEAEWEYACRAGTSTKWFWGNDAGERDLYARSDLQTHAVGEKAPNPWGLHDMTGNVWQWCWDWYGEYAGRAQVDPTGPSTGTFRVLRGGWSLDDPGFLRSAFRFRFVPAYANVDIGFRCVHRPRRQS